MKTVGASVGTFVGIPAAIGALWALQQYAGHEIKDYFLWFFILVSVCSGAGALVGRLFGQIFSMFAANKQDLTRGKR